MFKKSLLISIFLGLSLSAATITKEQCSTKGENFIFAGGECIEYKAYEGDTDEALTIIVHGTWDEGTNTLGRYAPFAESVAFQTDVTTVAVALPGYSNSSTNNFPALSHEGANNLSANKAYIEFLSELVASLKEKFEASSVTYVGHSAGCSMGSTLLGIKQDVVNNLLCAGGNFFASQEKGAKDLISVVDVLDNVSKDVKIALVYGTEDKISKPKVTKDFYKIAKDKGFNVKLIEAKGAPHLDLDMTDASVNAIIELIEEE